MAVIRQSYDYIVVGAGSAGCVLADRLSASGACVLLLEAGKPDRHIFFRMPLAFRYLWTDPRFNWGYVTEPEPQLDGRQILVPRGKVIGGSSSINGMLYARGHPRDYDQWRQMGLDGWGYDGVLPYYRRMESDWRGASEFHGGDGPLQVSRHIPDARLSSVLNRAAQSAGHTLTDDFHGAQPEGFGVPDFNVGGGLRVSTATAYLRRARRRRNLRIETAAQTTRVIFEGRRAIGVEYVQAGHRQTMHADREVILCGGAYNSPQLLMLSGIGPADDLAKHGIVTIQDLPGVGRNLQDHASVGVDCEMSQPWGFDHALRADRFAVSVLRWLASRTGPATALPVIGGAFIRTRPELERPDVQMLFTSVARDAHVWFPGIRRNKGHMLVNRAVLLHPDSRGHVALRSADPLDKPRITLNLLEHESDLATLRLALRKTREVLAQGPFDSLRGVELAPGSAVQSDDEIDTYIRRTVATAFHPVGTCAMGIGTGAVTDAQLRVHGVENLRVADASVMPTIIGGNTNAPTIMIGEKAADLVLGKG